MSTVRFCPEAPCTCGNSSAVEHRLAKAGVASSNLVSRSIHSSIAQLVEQSAVNRSVVGSSPTRGANFIWPVGQAVKTPPFHGGIPGSIPGRVTIWTISSAGRAPALQAGCRQFDPVIVHHIKRSSLMISFFEGYRTKSVAVNADGTS